MYSRRAIISLALIMSEVCYLYPVYLLVAFGVGFAPALKPWFLPALAATATALNYKFSRGSYRNLTIVCGNLVLLLVAVLATGWLQRAVSPVDYIVIWILLFGIFFRSIYLSRRGADVFLHFDLSVTVIFFILLITGLARRPWPGNSLAHGVFSAQYRRRIPITERRGDRRTSSRLGAALAAAVLVPLYLSARSFFPYLFQPAQFFYELGKPVAGMFKYLLYVILSFYFRFNAKTAGSPRAAADAGFEESYAGTVSESPWFVLIAKVLFWLLIFITAAASVALLLYLLGLLLNWLLKRGVMPGASGARNTGTFSWRLLLRAWGRAVVRLVENVAMLILPWLPGRIGIAQAYRVLLKWGSYRRYPRKSWETPYEYLDRLKQRFPGCRQELTAITASYVQFRYGKENSGRFSHGDMKVFLRRLYFPRKKVHPT